MTGPKNGTAQRLVITVSLLGNIFVSLAVAYLIVQMGSANGMATRNYRILMDRTAMFHRIDSLQVMHTHQIARVDSLVQRNFETIVGMQAAHGRP